MTWIIEGTTKYISDTGDGKIFPGNNFKIFMKDGKYHWTQSERLQEDFSGIGHLLTYMTDALDKYFYPKKSTDGADGDGGICRCGRKLPSVPMWETPFQYCSQNCKDEEAKGN